MGLKKFSPASWSVGASCSHSTHFMTLRKDKLLFTPGPLTTSDAVKEAMLSDVGSRDADFVALVGQIWQLLLPVAGVSHADG